MLNTSIEQLREEHAQHQHELRAVTRELLHKKHEKHEVHQQFARDTQALEAKAEHARAESAGVLQRVETLQQDEASITAKIAALQNTHRELAEEVRQRSSGVEELESAWAAGRLRVEEAERKALQGEATLRALLRDIEAAQKHQKQEQLQHDAALAALVAQQQELHTTEQEALKKLQHTQEVLQQKQEELQDALQQLQRTHAQLHQKQEALLAAQEHLDMLQVPILKSGRFHQFIY